MKNLYKIAVFDFETTGFDYEKDEIIEVGVSLWEYSEERKIPVRLFSALIDHSHTEITPEIEAITGIKKSDLEKYGRSPYLVFDEFLSVLHQADYWCGHNAVEFDQYFLFEALRKYHPSPSPFISKKLLIDTLTDVPYPEHFNAYNLIYLSAMHGFINPFSHRALTDTLATGKILGFYPIDQVIENARQERVTLIARPCPPWEDGGKEKDRVKSYKFRWDAKNKHWFKKIFKKDILAEQSSLPFETDLLMVDQDPNSKDVRSKKVVKEEKREWWLQDKEPFSYFLSEGEKEQKPPPSLW